MQQVLQNLWSGCLVQPCRLDSQHSHSHHLTIPDLDTYDTFRLSQFHASQPGCYWVSLPEAGVRLKNFSGDHSMTVGTSAGSSRGRGLQLQGVPTCPRRALPATPSTPSFWCSQPTTAQPCSSHPATEPLWAPEITEGEVKYAACLKQELITRQFEQQPWKNAFWFDVNAFWIASESVLCWGMLGQSWKPRAT